MKKFLIVFVFTIIIITFFITKNSKKTIMKGSDTKIAYWNLDSNILNKKQISLSETCVPNDNIENGYIAPRI